MALTDKPHTDIHDAVGALERSAEFTAFITQAPKHELVHVFSTVTGAEQPIEIGYYDRDADKITVFRTNPIVRTPPEEVFKEHDTLSALDLRAVRVGLTDVMARAKARCDKDYPQHPVLKAICILQQRDRAVWNLTIITMTMQMVNMQLDALSGEVLSCAIHSVMSLVRE